MVVVGRETSAQLWRSEIVLSRARGPWWRRAFGMKGTTPSGEPNPVDLAANARALDIDTLELSDPGAVRARARVRERAPDCFVVAGFHRLLPTNMLALAKRGGINVHPGRLPEERGPAPMFWMLKAGRTEGRVTVHRLDAGEDSGDVVAEAPFEIEPGTSGREALERAAIAAAPLLTQSVQALLAGTLVGEPQAHERAARCPRPAAGDCRVDPQLSAVKVFTYVAGCADAYPVYVECGGDRFFIARAVSYEADATMAFEYMLSGDRLILRCNPGTVELALKPDGALFTAEYQEESDSSEGHLHG